MPAHEDALLMAAGALGANQQYDFHLERVVPMSSETERRTQGMNDGRSQKFSLSTDPAYRRGYELGERLRRVHGH